eukprot:scaffold1417_cov113-Cylindrotheca_fusiformis.AAC.2
MKIKAVDENVYLAADNLQEASVQLVALYDLSWAAENTYCWATNFCPNPSTVDILNENVRAVGG